MLSVKGFAPSYENKRDAREFASVLQPFLPRQLAASAPKLDIAFFESTPMYGLKFYLGNNMLRVAANQPRDASFDVRLIQALEIGRQRPLIWVTESARLNEFETAALALGFRLNVLAKSDDFVVVNVAPAK